MNRNVKQGVLTAQKDAKGRMVISEEEVHRVYQTEFKDQLPPPAPPAEKSEKPEPARKPLDSQSKSLPSRVRALKSQVDLLKAVIASKEEEIQRMVSREAEAVSRELWHREQTSNFGYQVLLLSKQVSRIDDPGFSVQVGRMEENLRRLGNEREGGIHDRSDDAD